MAVGRSQRKDTRRGGRRRNYEPKVQETRLQRFRPQGWANWAGALMFGLLSLAVLVDMIVSIDQRRGADPVAAAVVAGLMIWMAVLFARNRLKD